MLGYERRELFAATPGPTGLAIWKSAGMSVADQDQPERAAPDTMPSGEAMAAQIPAELLSSLCRHLNDDPASEIKVSELKRAASLALLDHRMEQADRLLAEAEAIDVAAANQSLENSRTRLPFAAATRAARGTLAVICNDERQAAKHYAAACRSLSFRDTAGRWQLTMAEGRLLLQLGRKQNDPLVLTEAIATFKAAVAMLDPGAPILQRAETNFVLAETLIEAGRMVSDTIGDIQAASVLEIAIAQFAESGREHERGAAEIMLGQCLDRLGQARSDPRLVAEAANLMESGLNRSGAINPSEHATITRSLGATLYALAELNPSPHNFARAAAALERIETDRNASQLAVDNALVGIKLGTALARAGAGIGDAAMIRRGIDRLLSTIAAAGGNTTRPPILAARMSHAEALLSLGEQEAVATSYEEAALIYADLVADMRGRPSSLIAAHAYSGLADALRATAAMTGITERLTDAISAKRKAHDIFEKAGDGPNVAKIERDLRAIYDLAHLIDVKSAFAKSA